MTRVISMSDAKKRFPRLLRRVSRGADDFVFTRNGRPVSILRSLRKTNGLRETLEILANKDSMRQFRESGRYFARGGKGLTIEQVFGK